MDADIQARVIRYAVHYLRKEILKAQNIIVETTARLEIFPDKAVSEWGDYDSFEEESGFTLRQLKSEKEHLTNIEADYEFLAKKLKEFDSRRFEESVKDIFNNRGL